MSFSFSMNVSNFVFYSQNQKIFSQHDHILMMNLFLKLLVETQQPIRYWCRKFQVFAASDLKCVDSFAVKPKNQPLFLFAVNLSGIYFQFRSLWNSKQLKSALQKKKFNKKYPTLCLHKSFSVLVSKEQCYLWY